MHVPFFHSNVNSMPVPLHFMRECGIICLIYANKGRSLIRRAQPGISCQTDTVCSPFAA